MELTRTSISLRGSQAGNLIALRLPGAARVLGLARLHTQAGLLRTSRVSTVELRACTSWDQLLGSSLPSVIDSVKHVAFSELPFSEKTSFCQKISDYLQ